MTREIALDTETTGFKPQEGHRLLEVGAVEMENRIPTGKVFHCYINPMRDVPEAATNVHGLTYEFLKDKPTFDLIADDMLAFIGDARLIIHNAAFDMNFLNFELGMLKKPRIPDPQVFCTLLYARQKFPGSPASLDALCKRFNIDTTHRNYHGALLDATLLAQMYLELMGGAQNGLALGDRAEPMTAAQQQHITTQRTVMPPRPHAPSPEELSAHEAFVNALKNPLWKQA